MAIFFSAERRLVLRLLDYWQNVRETRRWPRFTSIEPTALGPDWLNCALLRWSESSGCFRFTAIGAALDTGEASLLDKVAAECPPDTLVGYAVESIDRALARQVPMSLGAERPRGDETILYRSIILPLGDEEETIGGFLLGVNCRVLQHVEKIVEFPNPDRPGQPAT
ncbi:MAG TPA: hypothetical protein VNT30_03650 [Stellaceae bacterium]|nr:hypothetical protein [Stellaceae bacterium]